MVSRLLRMTSWRDLQRHRLQAVLSLVGIALGVAVVVAVDLANESARRAFDLSMESLSGSSTHRIVATRTGPGLDEALYTELRVVHRVRPSTPLVEGFVKYHGQTFRLLGVDPFADNAFRAASGRIADGDLRRLLVEPNTLLVAKNDADRLSLQRDGRISVEAGGGESVMTIVGTFSADNDAAVEGLMIADIATAQEVLGRAGFLDRIELILSDAGVDRVRRLLPAGHRVEAVSRDRSTQHQMTAAFHTNLSAMGLLALLVGALLVYNTVSFSVLRRRREFGLLRVIGVTGGDLLRLVLMEGLLLGLLGSVLGVALGVVIGQALVLLVTRTISDLYFVLTVSTLLVSHAVLLKGLLVGLLTAVAASAVPAIDAARTPPHDAVKRSGVERRAHRQAPRVAVAGVLAILTGLTLMNLTTKGLVAAFFALFVLIVGYALIVPLCLLWLSRLVSPGMSRLFGNIGRLGTDNIASGLSRTGTAVAALAVALSATVGVGTMVESFRSTVHLWLGQTLSSDIYVSVADAGDTPGAKALPPGLVDRLAALPGVSSVSEGRPFEAETANGPVPALALNRADHVDQGFRFKAVGRDDPWVQLRQEGAVFVSEAFAFRFDIVPGQALQLFTPAGVRAMPVAAIFYDYSSDRGLLAIDLEHYRRYWGDPGTTTAGLRLVDGAQVGARMAEVRRLAADYPDALVVRANAEIRRKSMEVFDRTFAITHVLRLLAIGVAFIGVLTALLSLQIDRDREHATLRALGVTPRQLGGLLALECGVLGLFAGLLALPLGWAMSQLLIHVINRRSFGWSMQSVFSAEVLAEAVALAVVSALLAGLYPAWRLSRRRPAMALRDE